MGLDDVNKIQKEKLGKIISPINSFQINKVINWTETLYNIVDNFSIESSLSNNSEESIKSREGNKDLKNYNIKPNNNSINLEKEIKNKDLISISPSKNQNNSIKEDFTKIKEKKRPLENRYFKRKSNYSF